MKRECFNIEKFIASSDFRYRLREWAKLEEGKTKYNSEVTTRKMTLEEMFKYNMITKEQYEDLKG